MTIPEISLGVTLVVAIAGGVWNALHTARRFGRHETEFDQMKADVKTLKDESAKHGALDTSVQLLTQAMGTLERTISELRSESREARQEMKEAVADLKSETREALTEMRQDIRTLSRTN